MTVRVDQMALVEEATEGGHFLPCAPRDTVPTKLVMGAAPKVEVLVEQRVEVALRCDW